MKSKKRLSERMKSRYHMNTTVYDPPSPAEWKRLIEQVEELEDNLYTAESERDEMRHRLVNAAVVGDSYEMDKQQLLAQTGDLIGVWAGYSSPLTGYSSPLRSSIIRCNSASAANIGEVTKDQPKKLILGAKLKY